MMPQRAGLLFWLLVLTYLGAILFNFPWLVYFAKPLLMPLLALQLLLRGSIAKTEKLIVAGLIFSWMGDVFLLFESQNAVFFIAGLLSFLTTHVCYIIYFLSVKSLPPSLLKKQPGYILLVLCYGAALTGLLFPYLGGLKIPVIVYAGVICCMLLCSLHVYPKLPAPANRYFLTGAFLFVLSDSILAINKFYHSFSFSGVWVMLSYCAAQYLIVTGALESNARSTGGR